MPAARGAVWADCRRFRAQDLPECVIPCGVFGDQSGTFVFACWFSFQRSPKYLCLWPVCHPVVLVIKYLAPVLCVVLVTLVYFMGYPPVLQDAFQFRGPSVGVSPVSKMESVFAQQR